MFAIRITSSTQLRVAWPTADADIIAQVKRYIAYETTLPANQQLTGLTAAVLQAQLDVVQAADDEAKTAEEARALQANLLAQAVEQAKPKIAQATLTLKAAHFGTEARLEQWGHSTTIGKDGKISVRQPLKPNDIVAFMAQYVTQEASLPADERVTNPTFAEMSALNTTLQTTLQARNAAQARREAAVDQRKRETRKLLYLAQLACGMRIMLTYNGLITNDLERWGIPVMEPPTPLPAPGDPPETPA